MLARSVGPDISAKRPPDRVERNTFRQALQRGAYASSSARPKAASGPMVTMPAETEVAVIHAASSRQPNPQFASAYATMPPENMTPQALPAISARKLARMLKRGNDIFKSIAVITGAPNSGRAFR